MTPGPIQEDPESPGNRLLAPYVQAVRDLAVDFDAFCVDIHADLLAAIAAGGARWTDDGVHPNPAGHARMALAWLEALNW
jgi:lysophospholipase L1-like esterase